MKKIFLSLLLVSMLLAACQPDSENEIPSTGEMNSTAQSAVTEIAGELNQTLAAPTEVENTPVPPTEQAPQDETVVETATAAPAETATTAPAGAAAPDDPTGEVIDALSRLNDLESFRVEQSVIAPDAELVSEIDIIPPDRYHMVNPEVEVIVIGETAYIAVEGSPWLTVPGSGETIVGTFIFLKNEADAELFRESVSDVTFVGTEDLDGEETRVYRYSFTDPENESTGDVQLWVATADGLPRRQEMNVVGPSGMGEDARIENVYKDFDVPLTIEPPE